MEEHEKKDELHITDGSKYIITTDDIWQKNHQVFDNHNRAVAKNSAEYNEVVKQQLHLMFSPAVCAALSVRSPEEMLVYGYVTAVYGGSLHNRLVFHTILSAALGVYWIFLPMTGLSIAQRIIAAILIVGFFVFGCKVLVFDSFEIPEDLCIHKLDIEDADIPKYRIPDSVILKVKTKPKANPQDTDKQ